MKKRKTIRVLVADDSVLFREILANKLEIDPNIEVVAKASNAYEARDMILKYKPDVMTLDVEMPKMNGIEFLKKLIPQYPMPIIMVSSLNDAVFDALNAGAVDFVNKPLNNNSVDAFINELIVKIKIATTISIQHNRETYETISPAKELNCHTDIRLIAIGASTGGTIALAKVLKDFNRNMPGTVIVQHMPPGFTRMFAERLNDKCCVVVKEAEDGDVIQTGRVYIAAGDTHVRIIKKMKDYIIKTEKFTGDNKVNGHCPSVDVLFNSVAKEVGPKAIGIILTGMGKDGAAGLKMMRDCGAKTIAQDEATCVVYGMPKVAYALDAVDYQLPLNEISVKIINIIESNK